MVRHRTDRIDEWWNPSVSIVRFDEASLGRDAPRTNRTRGKAREKTNRLPNGEVSLDNADAVIDALQRADPKSLSSNQDTTGGPEGPPLPVYRPHSLTHTIV